MPASVGDILIAIRVQDEELGKLDQAGQRIDSFGQKGESAGRSLQTVGLGMAAVGAASGAMFTQAIMGAADFEFQMDAVSAALGGVPQDVFGDLSQQALDLGASTKFSAGEIAATQEALAKAGIGAEALLSGATQAVADLSSATGEGLVPSAEAAAAAMNLFALQGDQISGVADVFTSAMGNSSATLSDLRTGINNLGPVMANLNRYAGDGEAAFQDTAAAVAYFNSQGLKAADAGVSLARGLTNLADPTSAAAEQMGMLGFSALEANGDFKPLPDIMDGLNQAMSGMSDSAREAALANIFGAEAADVMNIAIKKGGDGLRQYEEAMREQGVAAEQAAIRQDNLRGALETLGGAIDTAKVAFGTGLLPVITLAAKGVADLVGVFIGLPAPVQTAISAMVGIGAAITGGLGAAIIVIPKILEFQKALTALGGASNIVSTALTKLPIGLGPLSAILAVGALAVLAYKNNWLGFGDAVDSIVGKITTFASQFGQIFDLFSNGSDAASGLTQRIEGFGKAVEFMTGLPVAGFFSKLASVLDEVGGHFASVGDRISELMGVGFTPLEAAVRALREEFPAFSGAIAAVGTVFQNLLDTAKGVGEGLLHAFDALRNGDLGGVFQGILEASGAAIGGLVENWRLIGTYLIQAFQAINWGEVSAALQTGLQNASSAFQQWFGTISQNLVTWFQSINWDAVGGMLSTGLQTAISTMGDVASLLLTKGAELISGLSAGFAQAWPTVSAWLGQVPTLIGAAIAGAGSLAEILITKGAELIGGLAAGFAQKWPEISAWLSQVPTLIGAAIAISGDITTLLLQKGVDLIGGLLTGFVQKWPEISSWLGNLAGLVGTAVTISTDLLLQKGIDLLTGLKSGIDQKWVEVDAWLAAMSQDITDTVGDLAQILVAKGNDLLTGLKSGIDQKWAEIDSWLAAMPQDISDTVGDLAQTLSDKGTALIQGLSTGAQDFWTGTVEPWLASVAGLASTAVGDLSQAILARGTELITGLSTGAQDFWTGTVEPWLATIAQLASTAVGELGQTLVDAGTQLLTGLQHGAQDIWNNTVGPWLQSLPSLIVQAVGDLSNVLFSAGQSVGQGLINGIQSMAGGVADAIGGLISGAGGLKDTALAEIDAHSPSRVFFQYGVWVVEGLINGIESMSPAAQAVMEQIFGDLKSRFTDSAGMTDTGKKAGKQLIDGVNETADIADLQVGSDEWYAALHDNIMGHFEDMGREGGKSLKKGLDEEVKSSSIMDSLVNLADINSALQPLIEGWEGVEMAIAEAGASSLETGEELEDMADALRLVGAGNKELTYMADQFDALASEVYAAGGTMETELLDRIGRLGKELPFALENAGMAFGRFGKMSADEVVKSMAQMIEGISATLRELVDVVREAFGMAAKEGTDAFAGVVEPGLKTAIQNSGEWIADGAKDWESALITTGEWAGQTIGEAMAAGMSAKEADWLNQMGFVVDRAIKKGVEGGKKGGTIGEETVKQAGEGVRRKERDYQDRMTEMVSKGADAGKAAATKFTEVGSAAVDATTKGMQSEQLDLLKAAETTVKALLKVFGDRVQAFYDIGKNFAEGLALGMQAGAADVQNAANDLGKSAEKELRKATESASPSKAAHRVGADVGKGFAEGIASGEEMTAKAARQLWRAAWKELKANIKEGGFLGRDWAVEFWEGMLNSPNMTGPLAQWITDQMVDAADTALKKIQAKIAGITAQLDIARRLSDSDIESKYPAIDRPELVQPVDIPQVDVPQPDPVDTSQRDMMQEQLEATRDLTDAITKAFEQAFSAAHKAHIAFVQGTISENEYLAKKQQAQDAYTAQKANATKIESLEAQVKAATAAIEAEEKSRKAAYDQQVAEAKATYDKQVAEAKAAADAENAARQAAYDEAVRQRQAQIDAEKAARDAQIRELEQAQRDAQMEMTQAVIDESNQRIAQYQKELSKTNDPQQKAELKAKIALEKERIDVANQLAEAIGKANASVGDMDAMAQANAQIQMLIEKLSALGDVDVGGMLQGIADAIMAAAEKIADAADKMKNAFKGGGGDKSGGGKDKGDKGTQDASDPSLSGGGGMGGGGMADDLDNIGKAAERNTPKMVDFGDKGAAAGRNIGTGFGEGTGVADKAIQKLVDEGTVKLEGGFGDAGTRAGKKMADNVSISIADGTPMMSKSIDTSVEAATVNGEKIGADRGKHIGVTIGTNMETGVTEKTRDVEKSVNGVVTESTSSTIPLAEKGGTEISGAMTKFMSQGFDQGTNGVSGDAKKMMETVGRETQQVSQAQGKIVGDDFSSFTAKAVDQGAGDVKRAGKDIMDGAGAAAKQDANRLGREAGDDLGRGVADGIRNQIQNVRDAGRDLSNAARDSVQKAGEIRSPSKVMMRLGKAMGDGYVIGLEDRIADARDAARGLVYAPQGLPGGELRAPGGNQGTNGQGGRAVTVNFNGPVNLPQVRDPEDFWPAVENLMRTHGVSSGRP